MQVVGLAIFIINVCLFQFSHRVHLYASCGPNWRQYALPFIRDWGGGSRSCAEQEQDHSHTGTSGACCWYGYIFLTLFFCFIFIWGGNIKGHIWCSESSHHGLVSFLCSGNSQIRLMLSRCWMTSTTTRVVFVGIFPLSGGIFSI